MDLFQIRVSDRLTTSADRILSPAEIEQLIAEGIIRPGGVLARFRFFINDFATRTDGIDLVGAYEVAGANGSTTTFSSSLELDPNHGDGVQPQHLDRPPYPDP